MSARSITPVTAGFESLKQTNEYNCEHHFAGVGKPIRTSHEDYQMTEPTIICPKCGTEIKLTESLAAPLIASTRLQFEKQLAQKGSDIAQREQAMRDKEKALTDAKLELNEQVQPCEDR